MQGIDYLDGLLNELNSKTNTWKSCSTINFLSENSIPVIDYNIKGYYKKMNLYDFLLTFKTYVFNI